MKEFKSPLSIRADMLYCPLSLALDIYYNCSYNCPFCYFRGLNHVWGQDFRVIDPVKFRRQLTNGLKSLSPKSSLAHSLSLKKTMRVGNKADPFQPFPDNYEIIEQIFDILIDLEWSFIIQTKTTKLMMDHEDTILRAAKKKLVTIMPITMCGLEDDWTVLERQLTTNPIDRFRHLQKLKKLGVPVGVNGEPFIPGYHTVKQFENTLKTLHKFGIKRYNTYCFHFTPYVAKSLHAMGIDIARIHHYNQGPKWKPILQQLLDLSKKYNILLGCPDWVNTPVSWKERANTCCGVHAANPSKFTAHEWRRRLQQGQDPEQILKDTWEGIGDYKEGERVMYGKPNKDIFTMWDAGFRNKRIQK